jgi:hypothetical protein
MALEPVYFSLLLILCFGTGWWLLEAVFRRQVTALSWKLIACASAFGLACYSEAFQKAALFFRHTESFEYKVVVAATSILIVCNMVMVLKFAHYRGRTTWMDRFVMFVLFGLSQGIFTFWVHVLIGNSCAPFTVWWRMCTDYAALGRDFMYFAVVGYWAMAFETNEENMYSTLSCFGHRVGVSTEGVDFSPEPSMTLAMWLRTLGHKSFFNRVLHAMNRNFNVRVDVMRKALDGVQVMVFSGFTLEIASPEQLDTVGEPFALDAVRDRLTAQVARLVGASSSNRVFELTLPRDFVAKFNQEVDPIKLYGLRLTSATALRADYYDVATRAFFNELATLPQHVDYVDEFMEGARRVYDKLSAEKRQRLTFEQYVAIYLTLSGKGGAFGQYGLNPT